MNAKILLLQGCLAALIAASGCGGVSQQVQAGRLALQTGRPNDAVALLMQAAEQDAGYQTPHRVRAGVLVYLGRAYYETNRDAKREAPSKRR